MAKSMAIILVATNPGVRSVISRVDPTAVAPKVSFVLRWASPVFALAVVVTFRLVVAIASASHSRPCQND